MSAKQGPEFTEPPPWTLDDVFTDTTSRTPIIFILSTGTGTRGRVLGPRIWLGMGIRIGIGTSHVVVAASLMLLFLHNFSALPPLTPNKGSGALGLAVPVHKLPCLHLHLVTGLPRVCLPTGADPTAMLQRFAEKKGWIPGERLHMISLGQGQGPIAEMLMSQAQKNGDWVCLQNCHLASSWMLKLEERVEEMSKNNGTVHEDFRLWLTSMPSMVFPVLVLQNGIKLTNEPPKGVKANVARTFNEMTHEHHNSCSSSKPGPWKKLLFSLSFFHAVVQERRKFGPIGWNIRYEFNTSDLECSMMTLRMFLTEQENIPWPALEYVIGQINYGGRVTDDLDRRCLMSVLRQFITPRVLDDAYKFTPVSGTYFVPPEGELDEYRDYLRSLPPSEAPEVFGMHSNANIVFQLQETRRLIDNILSIQPRVTTSGTGKSGDEIVAEISAEVQVRAWVDTREERGGGGTGGGKELQGGGGWGDLEIDRGQYRSRVHGWRL